MYTPQALDHNFVAIKRYIVPIFIKDDLSTPIHITRNIGWLVGWLCLTSHRQRGHLETAPPFTVPCEGREAR